MEFQLGDQPITIGRSADADIVLLDERVSRIHCGIRLWDGDFYIKDLKSRNGTWVNNQKIDVAKLKAGDVIRVGSTTLSFEQDPEVGTETAFREIEGKMDIGKGYTTILREIVNDTIPQRHTPVHTPPVGSSPASSSEPAPKATPAEPELPRVPLTEPKEEKRPEASSGAQSAVLKRRPITITIKRKS